MKRILIASSLIFVAFTSIEANSETVSAKNIAATLRLTPLSKLTVGPDDQYDGIVDSANRTLIFTRKADLISGLFAQDLETRETVNLLPSNADSQAPVFGSDGRLAFTYFKLNARGDICYASPGSGRKIKTWSESDIKCLERDSAQSSSQRTNPFWKSTNELGFLERDPGQARARIVVQNTKTQARTVLAEGYVWSPAMSSGGNYLAYNTLVSEKTGMRRRLALQDLASGKMHVARFLVPGISGFPSFSADGKQLYFSHYLNDTNNDRVIDGEDNAIVFRVAIADIIAKAEANAEIVPEQLTSAETSCSFPRPAADSLIVTCAFEGSLDIYRLPLSGVVPADWTTALVNDAIKSSRSYEDRILLFNALRVRGSAKMDRAMAQDLTDRLLSAHIFSDDTVAARFYLERLGTLAEESDQDFYQILNQVLLARELKKSQAPGPVTRAFQEQILKQDSELAKQKSEARFRAIARGYLRLQIERLNEASKFLQQARFTGAIRPLERYYQFEIARATLTPELPKSLPRLVAAYKELLQARELSVESQLYYTVKLLELAHDQESKLEKRITMLESWQKGLTGQVASLITSEILVLKLILADDKGKATFFKDIEKLMVETKNEYFLRKALYVRAISNLAEKAQFQHLTSIATNWLRFTKRNDTEFIYAREVFSSIALDRAYESIASGKLNYADNFFFESITLTDDLEAHAGHVATMMKKGERPQLMKRYSDLERRQFVIDNMKFVDAMLEVIEDEASGDADKGATKHLDRAIDKLETMTQDADSPVRHLLLGYCYLEKLLRTASGLDFNADYFQKSHQSLMLAYDLGRENARIKAPALFNLGILHSRVQNYGLAARFFALRDRLGFINDKERTAFQWFQAQALYQTLQADRAHQSLALIPQGEKSIPVFARQAFYLMAAGNYSQASDTYEKILASRGKAGVPNDLGGEENLAKIKLSYGYCLFKLSETKQKPESQTITMLSEALQHIEKLSSSKRGGTRLTDFNPNRLRYVAYGFLSQIGERAARLQALENRVRILQSDSSVVDDANSALVLAHLRLAELKTPSDMPSAVKNMTEALRLAEDIGESGQWIGPAVFRSVSGYMAHGLAHPAAYAQTPSVRIQELVERATKAYSSSRIEQPMLDYQRVKMEILWKGYSNKVLKQATSVPAEYDALLAQPASQRVREALPVQWQELGELIAALK